MSALWVFSQCYTAGNMLTAYSGWPLVWKTWKCQGIWNMSGKKSCHGKVSQSCSLLVEYLRSYGYIYIVISSFVIINYEIMLKLVVWSFTLKLVLQACYEYNLTWAWVPHIVREKSGNFSVSGEWSPCILYSAGLMFVLQFSWRQHLLAHVIYF